MTDYETSDRVVSRAIRSWLHEDRHEDASRIAGAVLDQVEATPRHRATWWPVRRTLIMNRILGFGLAGAALVAIAFVGAQVFGLPTGGLGSRATPTPSPASPAALVDDLAEGPLLAVEATASLPSITVTIPAPGWKLAPAEAVLGVTGDDPAYDVLWKGEVVDNYPQAAILLQPHPTDMRFVVSEDPCDYLDGGPGAATTVDEFAADLAAQPSLNASEPVDVMVDGHAGKSITLRVPSDIEWNSGRFGCADLIYVSYGTTTNGRPVPLRKHQGPGQIDELWILDVDGSIVVLDAMYRPDTSPALVEEMRAIIESATFESAP